MPTFPLMDIQLIETYGANTANSRGTAVQSSGSTNTKGSWVEITSATDFDCTYMSLFFVGTTSSSRYFLIDVAVGASSSEQVIINNILSYQMVNGTTSGTALYHFPVSIPAGSRVALRTQCNVGTTQTYCIVTLAGGGLATPETNRTISTYGADTTQSIGTVIDPGGTGNTKGAWVEIASATDSQHKELIVAVGTNLNTARNNAFFLFDVGIGAASSEVVILENIAFQCSLQSDTITPGVFHFPVSIPEGTRISVRAQCSITDADDRLFDVVIYGVS